MKSETSVQWNDQIEQSVGVAVQSQDWRLEYNGHGEMFDCPELLEIWSRSKLDQLLNDLVAQHIPTWESALQHAAPPGSQIKRVETGYR